MIQQPTGAAAGARMATRSPQEILDAVRAIPAGFVRTYGDLSPDAPRLAGRVLSDTSEDVPWWRVVRADGSLAVGEDQRRRLEAEGVPLLRSDPARVDMRNARLPDLG
jgi:alkylated DNA nucleotide flippase Atl1